MQGHNKNATGTNAGDPAGDAAAKPADQRLSRRGERAGASDGVTRAGARTPEELETIFEDTLMIRDPEAVAELFEEGAVLMAGETRAARSSEEISRVALAAWRNCNSYIADPKRVIQARDIALVVTEHGVNVARRSQGGDWRFAIMLQSIDVTTGRRMQ